MVKNFSFWGWRFLWKMALIGALGMGSSIPVNAFQEGFDAVLFAEHLEPVAIEVGPDGHLYVLSLARRSEESRSKLTRYLLDADGLPTGEVELLHRWEYRGEGENGDRPLGIAFDPAADPGKLEAYISVTRDPRIDPWGGRVVKVLISSVGRENGVQFEDKIVSLPVGFHEINQLGFGPDNLLYLCVGSTTTSGASDARLAGGGGTEFPEKLLSGAILKVDVRSIEGTLDVKTEGDDAYDPYAPGAKVRIFSSGIRQVYDVAWHKGRLYGGVNQNDVAGETGSCGGVPNLYNQRPDEFLAIFKEGHTYGFPNPTRGECVLMGGRPNEETQWYEIQDYPVGTAPPATFDPTLLHPIGSVHGREHNIGGGSANGILSYTGPGPYNGRLIQCFYGGNGQGQIYSFETGEEGQVVAQDPLRDRNGEIIRIMNNLDIAQHPNGILYVARYGNQGSPTHGDLWMLKPVEN